TWPQAQQVRLQFSWAAVSLSSAPSPPHGISATLRDAAPDCGHNRNFRAVPNSRCQPAGVTNIFVGDENIYVPPSFAGFGQNPVADSRVRREQHLQSCTQIHAFFHFNLHAAAVLCEFAQRSGNVEYDLHHRRFPRLTLFVRAVFRFAAGFALRRGLAAGTPSIRMTAALTHTICGSPSRIFFQPFPSSFEAYSFPLRFQNKFLLDPANPSRRHPAKRFRTPPAAATRVPKTPKNHRHSACDKHANALPACSETRPIPPARCTRSPRRGDASALRNRSPKALRARCPAMNRRGCPSDTVPSGFAGTIAPAGIRAAQFCARIVRTPDISLA